MKKVSLLVSAFVATGVASAAEILVATRSGGGNMRCSETSVSAYNGAAFSANNQYVMVGDANNAGYMYWGILGFQMPPRAFSSVTWTFTSAINGTISKGNVDVWCLGWKGDTTPLEPGCCSYADDMKMLNKSLYLNGMTPIKVLDDFIPEGESFTSKTRSYADDSLRNLYALLFNRGATTNDFIVLRFNNDTNAYHSGSFRMKGLFNNDAYTQDKCCRAVFTVPDRAIVTPASAYTEAERSGGDYFRSNASWAQYKDEEGNFGFDYPAFVGRKDGHERSLVLLVKVPPATTTNLNFTLVANEPVSGALPAGVNLELWALGPLTNRAANVDMALTAADFAGQTPVRIGEPVLYGGQSVSPGGRIPFSAFNTRALGRYLNSLVRTGWRNKWVALELRASAAAAEDWQLGIGSVATPGEESFLEGLAPVVYKDLFPNPGFENGLTRWSAGFGGYKGEVIECDFAYEGTHVLKIDFTSETGGGDLGGVSYNTYTGYHFSNQLWRAHAAVRVDSNPRLPGSGEYFNFIVGASKEVPSPSIARLVDGNAFPNGLTQADVWYERTWTGTYTGNYTGYQLYPNFRMPKGTTAGPTVYFDAIQLSVEQFIDFPKEKTGLMLMVR